MVCKKCGAELAENSRFCGSCGAPVETVEETAVPTEEPDAQAPEIGVDADQTAERTGEDSRVSISTMPAPEGVRVAPVPETAPTAVAAPAGGPAESVHMPASAGETRPAREKAPVRGNVGRVILSILLSLVLLVSLLASTLVTVLRASVSDDNLAEVISNIRFSGLKLGGLGERKSARTRVAERSAAVRQSAVAGSLGVAVRSDTPHTASLMSFDDLEGIDLDDLPTDDMDDLADYLYDMTRDQPGWEDVKKENIEEALDHPLVDEFLTEMATDYTAVIVKGEDGEGKGLTPDKVTDFVMEHEEEIQQIVEDAGYKGEFKLDEEKIRTSIADSIGDTYAPENIARDYSEAVTAFRLVVSLPVIIVLWFITALLVVLIFVVNKRRLSAVLSCVGIPALIVGLVYLAVWCAMALYPAMREGLLALVPKFLGKNVLITGASLAGGGIVLIVIKAIIRSVQKKRRTRTA